jgi:hypothetical protein
MKAGLVSSIESHGRNFLERFSTTARLPAVVSLSIDQANLNLIPNAGIPAFFAFIRMIGVIPISAPGGETPEVTSARTSTSPEVWAAESQGCLQGE